MCYIRTGCGPKVEERWRNGEGKMEKTKTIKVCDYLKSYGKYPEC